MDEQCIRVRVSGLVQGVFFRASTQEQARAKGISGYVKNLPDGRVEVVACGDEDALERLVEWLHKGPDRARVDHVDVETVNFRSHQGFNIK
ncbi:acylphosphatase [Marinobacter halodurans]|uniref:Acylphosphatase n=1 Tax=Marinobacter halodurans TaxID=2528979 RepID=A0ABY1ZQQ2_9GAMM|nr:acylphosphatase [Marinobacter halodurans]TBW59457.1 acylphosphatase [Marinobacter halodurans]